MRLYLYTIKAALLSGFVVLCAQTTPRVSVITSLHNGDEFIEGFMRNITEQTIFDQCEFIIVNADSPGVEEPVIKKYLERYPNIRYGLFKYDPGLYQIWNYAVNLAQAPYITNWNVDDRRIPESLAMQAEALDAHPEVVLVYSDVYISVTPNATYADRARLGVSKVPEFSLENMRWKPTGPAPMWRKSIHASCGFFNDWFSALGDLEFWNRVASHGHAFLKIEPANCIYYVNPQGVANTIDPVKAAIRKKEEALIARIYGALWRPKA